MKINSSLNYTVLNNNEVFVSLDEELKILSCDSVVFEEFLKICEGKEKAEIVNYFKGRFKKNEVEEFIETLVSEDIIHEKPNREQGHECIIKDKKSDVSIVYSGLLYGFIKPFLESHINLVDEKQVNDIDRLIIKDNVYIFCDQLSLGEMQRINNFLFNRGVQYIWVYHDGYSIKVGPHVIPGKTACFECYLTQRLKRIERNYEKNVMISALNDIKISSQIKEGDFSDLDFNTAARFLLLETQKNEGQEGVCFDLLDTIYSINSKEINPEKIKFRPISSCNCCHGNIKKYYDDAEFFFQEVSAQDPHFEKVVKYQKSGLRSVREEETEQLLQTTLKNTGLDIVINQVHDSILNDIIPVFDSTLKATHKNQTPYLFSTQESHGKGLDRKQAYFSAAFEIFERLSARFFGEKEILRASYDKVKKNAFNLDLFDSRILNRETPLEVFDPKEPVDWVMGYSLIDKKEKLVPASFAFFSPVCFRGCITQNSTSGLAAGATLEDAIIQGIYELIEHDAWAIGQANRIKLPILDRNTSSNDELLEKISKIENEGFKIITRDYTTDIGLPVFRTWISSGDYTNYATSGFGASLDPEIAFERSVTEAVQAGFYNRKTTSLTYGRATLGYLLEIPTSVYNMGYFINKDIKREENEQIININKYKKYSHQTLSSVYETTMEKLRDLGEDFDLIYVDLTKKSIKIPTVRVIATPHLQPIASPMVIGSKRLFTFQNKIIGREKPVNFEELYLGIYPH